MNTQQQRNFPIRIEDFARGIDKLTFLQLIWMYWALHCLPLTATAIAIILPIWWVMRYVYYFVFVCEYDLYPMEAGPASVLGHMLPFIGIPVILVEMLIYRRTQKEYDKRQAHLTESLEQAKREETGE